MRAIILAGGSGDRLWPLSRKEYPKQFIINDMGKSLFQETITRNLPYCDSFYVVTNRDYVPIIKGQLKQFQGLDCKLILEEKGLGTAPAIARAVSKCKPQDMVVILPSDLMIGQEGYSDAIYQAKELAEAGAICLFGISPKSASTAYGYIRSGENGKVVRFIEKPSEELAEKLFPQDNVLWNAGITLAKAGIIQQEYRIYGTSIYDDVQAYKGPAVSFDRLILEQSNKTYVVKMAASWQDVSNYRSYIGLNHLEEKSDSSVIKHNAKGTTIVNQTPNQIVVANDIKDALIVTTPDALYITSKDRADDIKEIIQLHADEHSDHFTRSPLVYRPWGYREVIRKESGFRVRKIMMYPGMKITKHFHEKRTETYTVISGELTIELGENLDKVIKLGPTMTYSIKQGVVHQLRNDSDDSLIMIEVDSGQEINDWDMSGNEISGNDAAEGDASFAGAAGADANAGADGAGSKKKSAYDTPADRLPAIYRLNPAYKDYLWGGDKLRQVFGKQSPYEITAESWELSAHPDGQSIIAEGPFAGEKFGDFTGHYGRSVCGWKADTFDRFPVLIKFIDARNPLSVQIHPDDDYAFSNENEFGKNEMWYVIDAEPGAYLYCGLSRETSEEELKERIRDNTLTEVLNRIEVHPGDVMYVPAGTIHAIGAGILICEIQQNSNCTYRMYDYGRVDKDGRQRQLHIEKALDVVNTAPYMPETRGVGDPIIYDRSTQRILSRCKYFQVVEYDIDEHEIIQVDESSFKAITVIEGTCTIKCGDEAYEAKPGDCFFIACGRKRVHIYGACTMLVTSI